MDKIEHLKFIYQSQINDESIVKKRLKSGEEPRFSVPFLEGTNVIYALNAFYIEHDYKKTKQCFYNAARVVEYMTFKYIERVTTIDPYRFCYPLVSDNAEVISRYTKITSKDTVSMGAQITNAIQNIIIDNREGLAKNIQNIDRFIKLFKKPEFQSQVPVRQVLNGFLEQDKGEIFQGLTTFLSQHKKRSINPLIPKFFSVDTCTYCKLAWIKGYEIDLKSSFVPIELMPVKPLETYQEYDFLV